MKLGQGASLVYLGKGEDGREVSIKVMIKEGTIADDRLNWVMYSFPYEYYASKYFEELGLPVAKVIGYKVSKGSSYLIKEYKHGLTYSEIKNSSNFSAAVRNSCELTYLIQLLTLN